MGTGAGGQRGDGGELRSVANALRLLSELAAAEGTVGVTELSRRLGVAPSTVYRLLSTLSAQGFATRLADQRRYRRGPALLRLGGPQRVGVYVRLREVAHPLLERLADRTRETTHLAALDGLDVVGIDHVESSQMVVARHPIGSRVPAHATAVGQALLAHLPEAAEAVIGSGLPPHTGETIADPDALRGTLEQVRDRGYAVNVGQWSKETAGVAAPVRGEDGEVVAALGISGPASRIGRRRLLAALGIEARATAEEITARLARGPRHSDTHGEGPRQRDGDGPRQRDSHGHGDGRSHR